MGNTYTGRRPGRLSRVLDCAATSVALAVACQTTRPTVPSTTPTPTLDPAAAFGIVATIAGSGKVGDLGGGYRDGPALSAQFRRPGGLAMDTAGDLYIADIKNQRIRKLTPRGEVTTVAGSGPTGPMMGGYADGPALEARFADPIGLCVGCDGSIYVADSDNQRIRRISPEGAVSTVAGSGAFGCLLGAYVDGASTVAQFNRPYDVVADAQGSLYVADYFNHALRRIATDGSVSTLAGTGLFGFKDAYGTLAELAYPNRITRDRQGNLFITEGHSRDMYERRSGNRVRRIGLDGMVTTVAGSGKADYLDGLAARAHFDTPTGLDVGPGGTLYVADYLNHCIRMITADGQVQTVAGVCGLASYEDGPAASALFSYPMDVLYSASEGLLYVADFGNHRIRTVTVR